LYGIEVRESGAVMLVELWGEFDVFCMGELQGALNDASSRRGLVMVDLSGITFLDLRSARELALRSMLRPRGPVFVDPSPQVKATMAALGLGGWMDTPPSSEPEAGTPFLHVSPSRT